MPLYEYECNACGIRFERKQHFTDDPVRTCPECGGAVHRLLQPVGIVFKGSGFYATDHRKGTSSSTSSSSSSSSKSSAAKSTPKESPAKSGSS